jgi:hypothetical protein
MEMSINRKVLLWVMIGFTAVLAGIVAYRLRKGKALISISGAVLQQDADLGKQLPIANADVSLGHASGEDPDDDPRYDLSIGSATTDSAGLFHLKLQPDVYIGQMATLRVSHPNYQPTNVPIDLEDHLYIVRMAPIKSSDDSSLRATNVLSDIRVRYATRSQISVDAGSATKTFEVVNAGNVPCDRHRPCSPDGKWKAAIGGASLDAGESNSFHEARVSCISGPCPFSKIEKDSFSAGGRYIGVTVRNWSDPVLYLIEAEVTHATSGDEVLHAFPAVFDRAMRFTLPPLAEGPSIEANLNGEDIIFPLGPTLALSWATCTVESAKDGTKLYHCLLKSNYRFR